MVVALLRALRHLGFAFCQQARHDVKPNRVHLRYGLIVHLQLLSTPPRGDAVTFGYSMPEHADKDFHLAGSMQLRSHIGVGRAGSQPPLPPNRAGGSPAHGSPVGGLTSKRIGTLTYGRFSSYTTRD